MENRIRCILLAVMAGLAGQLQAQQTEEVVDPSIARRDVQEARIDSEDFEVQVFVGYLSIEDFGSDWVYGARLAYHVTEDVFVEATYATSEAGTTSFEDLSGGAPILTDDERDYNYYNVVAGYNLNGEVYISDDLILNSSTYFVLGAGSTDFGGDDRFTVSLGAGYRLLLSDAVALHFDLRDHVFESDVLGEEKTVHNIEYTLGASVFF